RDCPVELMRKPERAREVPTGAAGDHGDLDAASPRDAVDDLVHRAVAADDDEQLRTIVRRARGELGELSRRAREKRVPGQAGGGRAMCDLGPSASRRAVRRRRVDEEDGFQWSLSAVTVASATRVMRSTASRSSSSVIRLNSPSTTMSLTVSRQPAWTARSAPTVKRADASISTASTPRFDQRSYWPSSGL